MNPRINIITVGVDDLRRAIAFYRDGLGRPSWSHPAGAERSTSDGEEADHAAFELEGGSPSSSSNARCWRVTRGNPIVPTAPISSSLISWISPWRTR